MSIKSVRRTFNIPVPMSTLLDAASGNIGRTPGATVRAMVAYCMTHPVVLEFEPLRGDDEFDAFRRWMMSEKFYTPRSASTYASAARRCAREMYAQHLTQEEWVELAGSTSLRHSRRSMLRLYAAFSCFQESTEEL